MIRSMILVASVGLTFFVTSSGATAQPTIQIPGGPPVSRPVFSPYLNLLRTDAPAAWNYYGLVKPQLNTQNSIQMLQQQAFTTQQQIEKQSSASNLPITGQPTFFLNTSGYFLNQRSGSAPTTGTLTTRTSNPIPQAPPSQRPPGK